MPGGETADPVDQGRAGLSFQEYARHVSNAAWVGGVPWHMYGRVLMPLCMPHVPLEVERAQLRKAMSQHHALLACWTTEWDRPDESEWWWVACDRGDYDVERLPSAEGRRDIRKGLRECVVRQVEPGEFSRSAYAIHRAALESYGAQPPTQATFAESVRRLAGYSGTEFWGAFRMDDMASFTVCQIRDGAVDLSMAKSAPRFHRHEPNAALFYTVAKHYLDSGLKYVTNGSRTLSHPTSINDFLEKLGFRKVFCKVDVELSPAAKLVGGSGVAHWGRAIGLPRLLGNSWKQVDSFATLLRIAGTFR